ncbi:vWA domain-containing protein [Mycolicibacterium diernhoferi]|uniref:VWA domain-containing protein n=3 Tax=Mycolicibacterium diernhoferi TaxID=1801 RepID=A0A1Q4H9U7_9MYCO|nr:VWA domain-containing protein [Mycolicibacterium diernhoferi]OJZ64192.1 hypothetical protein BRW64_19025 [Mycolicibacterium diernhoferi]OPE49074.1 hypothetical protein BV510_22755 [Mycolicibacterium diernhoferi]PEG55202.1 VWA domain-containing protein [Mycolicibacterium diernhoferi]
MLVLDGSASMAEQDAPGPRIEAAKAAARGLIDAMPDDAALALQTYGTAIGTTPEDKAAGYGDVSLLLSLRPLDREIMYTAIDSITPSGSGTGLGNIHLGSTIDDIRATIPDFPDTAGTGSTTVVWRDCDFTFVDGVLDTIGPRRGGRTIDGIAPGKLVAKSTNLHRDSLTTIPGNGGTTTVIFDAASGTDNAYRMTVEKYAAAGDTRTGTGTGTGTGTIKSIVLCRCKPREQRRVDLVLNTSRSEED